MVIQTFIVESWLFIIIFYFRRYRMKTFLRMVLTVLMWMVAIAIVAYVAIIGYQTLAM